MDSLYGINSVFNNLTITNAPKRIKQGQSKTFYTPDQQKTTAATQPRKRQNTSCSDSREILQGTLQAQMHHPSSQVQRQQDAFFGKTKQICVLSITQATNISYKTVHQIYMDGLYSGIPCRQIKKVKCSNGLDLNLHPIILYHSICQRRKNRYP